MCRLEEEITQRRSISDLHEDELKGSRRGSGSARRSFFRRKKHQRSSSKESRELTSYSDVSINSDSVPYLDGGYCTTDVKAFWHLLNASKKLVSLSCWLEFLFDIIGCGWLVSIPVLICGWNMWTVLIRGFCSWL